MTPATGGAPKQGPEDLEAQIDCLHLSVDGLADAVAGLKSDFGRQADRMEDIGRRQVSGFRELMGRLHETYKELSNAQGEGFRTFGDRLDKFDDRLDRFGDRLDVLVERQHKQATELCADMRRDFSRVIDRQDSHFRWLVGIAVSVGVAVAALLVKAYHP